MRPSITRLIQSVHGPANPVFFLAPAAGLMVVCLLLCVGVGGCAGIGGYSQQSLYPENVGSVCVHMFDNRTFWRHVEYDLTDALSKRIEAQSPYKIVSNENRADTVISGQIMQIGKSVLVTDRETGHALENELQIQAVVNWKNLKTGELLLDSRMITASASYSTYLDQGQGYASMLATNKLAERIVELMQSPW